MLRALTALLAGLALPLAFAPYGWWPCAILALAALFWTWRVTTPRAALWRGFLFGIGAFGHGVTWIQVSIHKFGLPLYSFSVSMTVLFVLIMSSYPAAAGWLARRLPGPGETWRMLAVAPACWVLMEALRGVLFSGFPWLVVGYGQVSSWFAGYTPLAGAYGTSLAVAVCAGACAQIAAALRAGAAPRRPLRAAAVLALALPAAGLLLARVEWTRSLGEPLTAALVQGAVPQAIKWQPEYRGPTLELYSQLSAPHWGKRVVIWPETALPAFPGDIADFLRETGARAREAGTAFLVGMPTGDPRGRYFNSLVMLGVAEGRYDKHHLVPYGEYLPMDALLRPVLNFLSIPMSSFSAGDEYQPPLTAGRLKFGVSICYEDAYGSEVRKPLPDANVLVNVSDDAWFGDSLAPHQHLEIAQVRALEAGRPMLRATNTGISAIIDHQGRVLERSPQFEPFVLTGSADPRTGATPFVRFGNWPVLLLCLGLLGIAWRARHGQAT